MDRLYAKNLSTPDETIEFDGIIEELVDIAGFTVGRSVQQPGWRWSTHDPRAKVEGAWCGAHHVGVVLSGRWGAHFRDGSSFEWGPDDVFDCPPGHDGYTVGDEPCVMLEWSGLRTFVAPSSTSRDRSLATLLFTDIVGSTAAAAAAGDEAWHELLAEHYRVARAQLERFGGSEVTRTGDGLLAIFDAPARAIRCATALRDAAHGQGLEIRAGIHVGEITIADDDVHGVAVHLAARIMAAADPDEILISDIARTLASGSGLTLEDAGERTFKGFPEPQRIARFVDDHG
jgi:class 3 adenylate cyclase